jgi:hypothetical protein
MDVSVTMMMKNAVKCDNNCDMQPPIVSQTTLQECP